MASTTTLPCKCCDLEIPVKMSCRTRSGTQTLCGFSEYHHPVTFLPAASVPPKKYRTQTLGQVAAGGYGKCNYPTPVCSGITDGNQDWRTISGTYKYSQTTCAETNTQEMTVLQYHGVPAVCLPQGSPTTTPLNHQVGVLPSFGVVEMDVPHAANFVTRTTFLWDGDGYCFGQQGESGNLIILLSDEDTETDAIARAIDAWTGWTVTGDGSGVPATCFPWVCCLATTELRVSGFSFLYQSAQYRIVNYPSTLLPSTNYTISVLIYRKIRGSADPFVLYQTLTFPVTTDALGDFPSFDGNVPNDPGFDTYSGSAFARHSP